MYYFVIYDNAFSQMIKMFEGSKGVIKSSKSKNDKQYSLVK
jgi:hypothetical protein